MRVSLETKILIGFALAVTAALVTGLLAYSATFRLIESGKWVANSHEVRTALESTISTLKDAETGARGFVITGSDVFLEPYNDAGADIQTDLRHLAQLTRDNPPQRVRIPALDSLVAEQIDDQRAIVRARRTLGFTAAVTLVASGQGRAVMDRVRTAIDEMEQVETRVLAQRLGLLQTSVRTTISMISALLALTVTSLVAIFLIVRRELASRRRAEVEERGTRNLLDSVVENMPAMVFLKDAGGLRFVRFNRAAEAMTGFSRDEMMGKTDYDFFPREEADFFRGKDQEVLREDKLLDVPEEPLRTKGGNLRILHTRKIAIKDPDGNPRYLLGISEDVTEMKERKEAEQKAAREIEDLYQRLERRAAELEAANRELEAFSYSVSHDLRAPLRHINGFAGLLMRHAAEGLDEKSRGYLDMISGSARQLGVLIDELLVFSRMGRTEMRRSQVNLRSLTREVIDSLEDEWKGRDVDWLLRDLPEVHGDPSMLRLVMVNLLSNAVKFTRTRKTAHIEVGRVSAEGAGDGGRQEDVVFVRDNGVGFDMRYAGKLYGVFQRLHNVNEFEGTGIGLANVRRIIQRHGGRTWAEGVVGRGATFYFSLPRVRTD